MISTSPSHEQIQLLAVDSKVDPPVAIGGKEAAKMFSVSLRTWERMHASNKIPAPIKLGGCRRWDRAELLLWWGNDAPPRSKWEQIKPQIMAEQY